LLIARKLVPFEHGFEWPVPAPAGAVEGWQLSGWAPGALQRWLRSATGQWIGVVTFIIEQSDGTTYKAVEQLVRAEAMRPRDDTPKRAAR
jgi:hypothetical protein